MNTGGYATGVRVPGEPQVMNMIFGKRCFFGYTAMRNGEVWWFANPPRATEPTPEELARITPDEWRAYLNELFADDAGPALEIIANTPDIFLGWNTYDLPKVPRWHNERMIIIGDAAHATTPSSGQGASMAIEDALVLAQCLRDLPEISAAFTRYEALRRKRVERIVAHGRRSSSTKVPGPFGRAVLDLVLPIVFKRLAKNDSAALAWMYDHHIEWGQPVAR
jgi:2-polyprenyl-6-methoxyphenol hydroxylase-like FAD-dependent oxidoreductase